LTRPAVLLDTNLLVLLVVGNASRAYVRSHKRLGAYDERSYDILVRLLSGADALVVTPNILTETSNLLGRKDDEAGLRIVATFRAFIGLATEAVAASEKAAQRAEFARLGLADAAALDVLDDRTILLTDDFPLYDAATRAGRQAQLFAHHREAAG
jgi:hypothetical protein